MSEQVTISVGPHHTVRGTWISERGDGETCVRIGDLTLCGKRLSPPANRPSAPASIWDTDPDYLGDFRQPQPFNIMGSFLQFDDPYASAGDAISLRHHFRMGRTYRGEHGNTAYCRELHALIVGSTGGMVHEAMGEG